MQIDKELDARGLNCPLPLMKTKKTLTDMQVGQVLRVVATDSGSVHDMLAFTKKSRPRDAGAAERRQGLHPCDSPRLRAWAAERSAACPPPCGLLLYLRRTLCRPDSQP